MAKLIFSNTLNVDTREKLMKYQQLSEQIKNLQNEIETLKKEIGEMFEDAQIVDTSTGKVLSVKNVLVKRRTLDNSKLLHFIREKDLEKCYDNKEISMVRISIKDME